MSDFTITKPSRGRLILTCPTDIFSVEVCDGRATLVHEDTELNPRKICSGNISSIFSRSRELAELVSRYPSESILVAQ